MVALNDLCVDLRRQPSSPTKGMAHTKSLQRSNQ